MIGRIGQKIVCVIADRNSDWMRDWLTEGAIYTIADIGPITRRGDKIAFTSDTGFALIEVDRRHRFNCQRFRPIVERKTETGMAILNKILKTQKIEEKV